MRDETHKPLNWSPGAHLTFIRDSFSCALSSGGARTLIFIESHFSFALFGGCHFSVFLRGLVFRPSVRRAMMIFGATEPKFNLRKNERRHCQAGCAIQYMITFDTHLVERSQHSLQLQPAAALSTCTTSRNVFPFAVNFQ